MTASAILEQLAIFVSEAALDLDDDVTAIVRDALIDTLGCFIVGADEEVARYARAALDPVAGGKAPVFGTAMYADPESAAFLNAVAGHALDLDDWEIPGNSHASVVILPALLAAGSGQVLGGQRLCAAYAAGFEVIARLGEAVNFEHYARGWHTTGTLACIGAAAAVCRLWDLPAEQTCHALSLAVSRAAGLTRQFGSHAKPLQAGFAAENALRSARLARAGLTGQPHVLEGGQGYFALTAHGDEARQRIPFSRLGRPLALAEYGLVIKPYPSCGYTHRVIDCARELRARGLDRDRIGSIRVELPDFHAAILPFAQPSNRREALFSLPFCAAIGLSRGDLQLDDLDREAWCDAGIRRLIEITRVEPFAPARPQLNYDPEEPDRLTLELDGGESLTACVAYPRGAPQNRLGLDDIFAKFHRNAGRRHRPEPAAVAALAEWPACDDLNPLLESIGVMP